MVDITASDLKGYKVSIILLLNILFPFIVLLIRQLLLCCLWVVHIFFLNLYFGLGVQHPAGCLTTLTSSSSWQEASAAISGAGVFGKLKFESGIHRVQVLLLLL